MLFLDIFYKQIDLGGRKGGKKKGRKKMYILM